MIRTDLSNDDIMDGTNIATHAKQFRQTSIRSFYFVTKHLPQQRTWKN